MKRFLFTFGIVALILFARLPHALVQPALFAEDGIVFFQDQYEAGFFRSFLVNYAGYAHATARIIACVGSLVPLQHIPFAYALASLLIAATSFSIFALPLFRQLIRGDNLRTICCILFTIMPNAESLMKVAYIDWYILFAFLLLLLIELPHWKWCLLPFAILATWTSPVAIVATPVVIYRCLVGRTVSEKIWWAIVQVSLLLYFFQSDSPPGALRQLAHTPIWMLSLLDAFFYRVVLFFVLGDHFSSPPFINGWWIPRLMGVGAILLAGPVLYGVRKKISRNSIIMAYLIVSTACVYILRPDSWDFFLEWTEKSWALDGRHFYCSLLLLCTAMGMAIEKYGLLQKYLCQVGLLIWICLHVVNFRLFEWYSPVNWAEEAALIKEAESKPGEHYVRISVSPAAFNFILGVKR